MSLWTAIGKAAALWSQYGDKIEATMDIWLAQDKTPAKSPADVADELRAAVGNDRMTPGERDRFNREHNIHVRKD